MGELYTTTGTRVFISSAEVTSATDTAAEYAALTWVEIGMVENIGDFGDEASVVTASVIGDGRIRKLLGADDAGEMPLVVFDDPADVGQTALVAAKAAKRLYGFKVQATNMPEPGGTGSIEYFRGYVRSKRKQYGANDTMVRRSFTVSINSPVTDVAPADGP